MNKVSLILFLLISTLSFSQKVKFGKVSKKEIEEKYYPGDSTADAAYLYKSRRSYFSYNNSQGFQLITDIHERIKVYTQEGYNYATNKISYYDPDNQASEGVNGIKGYTFSIENGKVVKEKLSRDGIFKEKLNKYNSMYKITMPNVKVGCVLELKYSIFSPYATSIPDVEFQKGIPIKDLKSRIEVPEYFVFNKRNKGYYNIPVKQTSKTSNIGDINFRTNIYSFESENIPALKDDEAFVANINTYRGGIKFELASENFISIGGNFKSYSNTWENISKQIYSSPSFGSELRKTNYYKSDLQNILATAKTDQQKLFSIFQFVKSNVKWNGFYGKFVDRGVKNAFKENTGNVAEINLILTSMLRSAGLNANPVLVSSRGNGRPLFPTIKGFDYVISMVTFPDNTYALLDASEPYSLPNVLPSRVLNWNGMMVAEGGISSWVKLTASKHAKEENIVKAKLSDDFELNGFIRTKYQNLSALSFRRNYNHIKEDELINKIEDENNIEVEEFKLSNKNLIGKPLIRNVKFISEDLVEKINNKIYIEPLLFLTKKENPFKLDERKFPVDFATAWEDKDRVVIEIPENYKVESIPEPIAIALPDNIGVFKFQVSSSGNKINTVSKLQFNKAIIPSNYYPYLKDFYSKLVEKESEKIVLIKI